MKQILIYVYVAWFRCYLYVRKASAGIYFSVQEARAGQVASKDFVVTKLDTDH